MQRGLRTFPQSAKPTMEMMENRLARVSVAVRILGIATRALAAYADTYLLQGAGILGWRRRMVVGSAAAEPILARCRA